MLQHHIQPLQTAAAPFLSKIKCRSASKIRVPKLFRSVFARPPNSLFRHPLPHPSFLFPLFLWGHHFRALFGGGAFNKTLPEPLCIQDSGRSAEGKITVAIGYCDKILHVTASAKIEWSKEEIVPQEYPNCCIGTI